MSRPKVTYSKAHARDISSALQRERPDLELGNYMYLLYAQRIGQIIDTAFERFCREKHAMSAADMRVLLALRRSGGDYTMRPTELYRSLLVTSGAITKQVDRLEANGFVVRLPGPAGSGGLLVHLTDKGFEKADGVLTSLDNSEFLPRKMFGHDERQQATEILERMLVDLENWMDTEMAG